MSKSATLFRSLTFQSKRFNSFTPYKLPDLPYDYSALEPVMSSQILEVHHKKHHQTYVNNFNASVEQLLSAKDPVKITSLQGAIKFNGGGHINHSIFWTNLSPVNKYGGQLPGKDSSLAQGLVNTWGSIQKFQEEFSKRATAIQVYKNLFMV